VVLTARTVDGLVPLSGQLPQADRWIVATENLAVRGVGAFGSADDHARWRGEAARVYAIACKTAPPDLPEVTATGNTAPAEEPMLVTQAKALLAVLDSQRRRTQGLRVQGLPFGRVAEALFEHEQDRWQQAARQPQRGLGDLTGQVQQRAIAALMLSGAADEAAAVEALRAVPDLADESAGKLASIARWAFHLYPPGPVQIRPSMLAEWFLITQLTDTPGLVARLEDLTGQRAAELLILFAHASDHMATAVPLYVRLVQADPLGRAVVAVDAALTTSRAQPRLDAALAALIADTDWPTGTLDDLGAHLPEGVLPRTRAAVSSVAVYHARQTGTPEDLARALIDYGDRLRDLGRHQEALVRWPQTFPGSDGRLHRVFGGEGGVDASRRGAPDQDAGFRLLQGPSVTLFASVMVPAQRRKITLAGDAALLPGQGVIQIAPGGGPGAAGRGAPAAARADQVRQLAAGLVAGVGVPVVAAAPGDGGQPVPQPGEEPRKRRRRWRRG
jgi:hypothetical protein